MLVNVGYAAVRTFGSRSSALVVRRFALTFIVARIAGAATPDRAGPRATPAVAAPPAAAGLVVVAPVSWLAAVIAAVVELAAGRALAVPALGLPAPARVAPARHGAAAGMFFAWFGAGVGLGAPAAHPGGPTGALAGAAAAVVLTVPAALISTNRPEACPLVN